MNLELLLEYLEIDDASEFEYFENLADLIEADMVLDPEVIYPLFEAADKKIMAELFETYFEELLKAVPEDAVELYTMLDSMKLAFMGMTKHLEEDRDLVFLSDEFCRFRNWYSLDPTVWVQQLGETRQKETCVSLRDALTLSRMEALGEPKYEYNFEEALNYEINQYTMSFADLMAEAEGSQEESPGEEGLENLDIPGIEYTHQIFTPEKLH